VNVAIFSRLVVVLGDCYSPSASNSIRRVALSVAIAPTSEACRLRPVLVAEIPDTRPAALPSVFALSPGLTRLLRRVSMSWRSIDCLRLTVDGMFPPVPQRAFPPHASEQ
jgi:hypothetical protein